MPNLKKLPWEKKEKILNFLRFKNARERLAFLDAFRYKKNLASLVYKNKPWKYLTDKEKLIVCFAYLIDKNYTAVTLKLSSDLIAKIQNIHPKKRADFLRRLLNANLKNNFGFIPASIWIVEGDKNLHLHGIIKMPPHKNLHDVLKRTTFGKNYKNNPMNRFIVKTEPIYAPMFWLRYMAKDFKNTKTKVYNDFYVCQELTKATKKAYETHILHHNDSCSFTTSTRARE